MNISSLMLAIVYLALSIIPVLYNHYASRNIAVGSSESTRDLSMHRENTALNNALPRGLIVFINNLSDEQLKSVAAAIEGILRRRSYGDEENLEAEVRHRFS
ncbi:MAG: hypothetical protein QW369_02145 [Desulfurococcaceae archaeon]